MGFSSSFSTAVIELFHTNAVVELSAHIITELEL